MLLKISLGIAILVGLATLYVTHVQVGGKITNLNNDLASTQQELETTRQSEAQLRTDLRGVRTQLEDTTRTLQETTNQLAQVTARAEEQFERANKASAELLTTTEQRNEAQRELAQWRAFEMTPDQIRNSLTRLRTAEDELNVARTDIEVLNRENRRVKNRLAVYEGPDTEVELPPGTKGNIIAVDPKYDFVVLDIGGNQGVLERAKMLVNRDGKLIGRVQIMSVEPNRSVANILPEWKQDEIMEGDQVIF